MKRTFLIVICALILTMAVGNVVSAIETVNKAAEQSIVDEQTIKQLIDLAKRYDVAGKLPRSTIVEGKPCTKEEAVICLLAVIEKIIDKSQKEGKEAIAREDLDKLAALRDALQGDLEKSEGYQTSREAIESVLARPETPPFIYRVGVNGFFRGEGAGNFHLPDFSYTPEHGEGRFLYRVKPYTYWHPTDWIDIHAEGQGYGYLGGGQGYSRYSLYQGFVEAKIPGKELLALKVGRQELSYGNTFMLGANAFFDGLVYDAIRLRIRPLEGLTIDLFSGFYASPFATGLNGNLTGAYTTYRISEGNTIEFYGLRDTGSTGHSSGEHRDIWGLRGTAELGPVDLELEPVYETGSVPNPMGGNNSVSAYGGQFNASFESILAGRKNRFALGYALGSGDKEAATGVGFRREFRNTNNDEAAVVGDMKVIPDLSGITVGSHHASGLHVFTLGWGIDIVKDLNFTATGHYFIAQEVEDGFKKGIGQETDFIMTYALNDNVSLIMAYDHFFTGPFFRDATGSKGDIHYGYLVLQFDISKSRPRLKPVKE